MKLEKLCNEYRENKRMIEELTALNEGVKSEIIAMMGDNDTMIEGSTKVTIKTVSTTHIDTAALKSAAPEIYTAYSVTTHYKRFTVI